MVAVGTVGRPRRVRRPLARRSTTAPARCSRKASGSERSGRRPRGPRRRQRRARRALRRRPAAPRAADDAGPGPRCPAGFDVATAPRYPLRGHQLGYRPKTNSYDGWDLAQWEQYIRDLAVFGTNAIELIPPALRRRRRQPALPLPPMEMMVEMSRLADEYGLDVWIWYPAMDRGLLRPEDGRVRAQGVGRGLPQAAARSTPSSSPAATPATPQPKYLMALLEKQTEVLHRHHPKAQMWVSPQGFNQAWMDEFLAILQDGAGLAERRRLRPAGPR